MLYLTGNVKHEAKIREDSHKMEVKDEYSVKMRSIIEDELKNLEVIEYLDEECILYLSNYNMFIKDIYIIATNIKKHIKKNLKIDIEQLKEIVTKSIK